MMSVYSDDIMRMKETQDYASGDQEMRDNAERSSISPSKHDEAEKQKRREIANSNERRRMQSINAGFQSLKTLIPHSEGEKLSKAAILQQTLEHLHNLEREKTKLLAQNVELKRIISDLTNDREPVSYLVGSPPPKRKKRDTESSDEGVILEDDFTMDEMKREMIELRIQLDKERNQRKHWERISHECENRLQQIEQIRDEEHRKLEEKARKEQEAHDRRARQINDHLAKKDYIQKQMEREKMMYAQKERMIEEQKKCEFREHREHRVHVPSSYASPMSQKNLLILADALLQNEGERIHYDHDVDRRLTDRHSRSDGEKDSSASDREDTKSECSGRDSPSSELELSHSRMSLPSSHHQYPNMQTVSSSHQSYKEKYPIAMHLLNRPLTQVSQQVFQSRPGVIVHKSS